MALDCRKEYIMKTKLKKVDLLAVENRARLLDDIELLEGLCDCSCSICSCPCCSVNCNRALSNQSTGMDRTSKGQVGVGIG